MLCQTKRSPAFVVGRRGEHRCARRRLASRIARHQPAIHRDHRAGQEGGRGQAQAQGHVREPSAANTRTAAPATSTVKALTDRLRFLNSDIGGLLRDNGGRRSDRRLALNSGQRCRAAAGGVLGVVPLERLTQRASRTDRRDLLTADQNRPRTQLLCATIANRCCNAHGSS